VSITTSTARSAVPLPLQEGGLPLWVAGGGERKTLRIAAKYARYTNFGGILDIFRRKSEILARHCRDLGTDFDAITRSSNCNVLVGETQADVDDQFARLADLYGRCVPADQVEAELKPFRHSPTVGTPEQVVETLRALYDAGMTYAICYFPTIAHDPHGVELFERAVIPALS
jgi:alkanesulfonate monooxygenase SsuD/methylene tetrahydromethanopterin reductase-like flavin-dependent oxidoreductase (luciferase family)